jgi:rhodanese-related sulfurtransferase
MFGFFKSGNSISPKEAKERLASGEKVFLIDVRTPEEYKEGHIPKSILVPLDSLRGKIEKAVPQKDSEIIVYCRSGARAGTGQSELIKMGYTNVKNLGGIMSWPYEIEV